MDEILKKYNHLCSIESDINEHLPILKEYGEKCEHITEMGVRYVVSTWAFLASRPKKMISYDILDGLDMNLFNGRIGEIKIEAERIGTDFSFIHADVLKVEIEETDLLMIDTYHEYNQMKKELELHGNKAKKFLIFHDTHTFGRFGETFKEANTVGIWPAIQEFMENNPHWVIEKKLENNNGLTILKNTK